MGTVACGIVRTGTLASVRVENQGLLALLFVMAHAAALFEAEVLFHGTESKLARLVATRGHCRL